MQRSSITLVTIFLFAVTFALGGCDSDSMDDDSAGQPAFEDGIVATFDVLGSDYRIWITNENTIDQVMAVQNGTSDATVPSGVVLPGPGEEDHNEPWSWHISPEAIQMVENAPDTCDGTPQYVEQNVPYFVDENVNYCPSSAVLVDVEDYR